MGLEATTMLYMQINKLKYITEAVHSSVQGRRERNREGQKREQDILVDFKELTILW